MNEFDVWRAGYGKRTMQEEMAYHNDLEARFPDQAHFNLDAAFSVFNLIWPTNILEAGAWKGDLAKTILATYPHIEKWQAYEISTEAIAKTVCDDPRFYYTIPDRFDWFCDPAVFGGFNLFIATHFIEHISDEHFRGMAAPPKAGRNLPGPPGGKKKWNGLQW